MDNIISVKRCDSIFNGRSHQLPWLLLAFSSIITCIGNSKTQREGGQLRRYSKDEMIPRLVAERLETTIQLLAGKVSADSSQGGLSSDSGPSHELHLCRSLCWPGISGSLRV